MGPKMSPQYASIRSTTLYLHSGELPPFDQRKDINRYQQPVHQLFFEHVVQTVHLQQEDILNVVNMIQVLLETARQLIAIGDSKQPAQVRDADRPLTHSRLLRRRLSKSRT